MGRNARRRVVARAEELRGAGCPAHGRAHGVLNEHERGGEPLWRRLGKLRRACAEVAPRQRHMGVLRHGARPGLPPRTRDEVALIGTQASATFDGAVLRLLGEEPEEREYPHDAAYEESFDACVAHFAAALREGTPFETAPEDNLETLRLVEAAYAGRAEAASGRPACSQLG